MQTTSTVSLISNSINYKIGILLTVIGNHWKAYQNVTSVLYQNLDNLYSEFFGSPKFFAVFICHLCFFDHHICIPVWIPFLCHHLHLLKKISNIGDKSNVQCHNGIVNGTLTIMHNQIVILIIMRDTILVVVVMHTCILIIMIMHNTILVLIVHNNDNANDYELRYDTGSNNNECHG